MKVSFYFLVIIIFSAVSMPMAAGSRQQMIYGAGRDAGTDFFEKVYRIFEDNYYLTPDRKVYDHKGGANLLIFKGVARPII